MKKLLLIATLLIVTLVSVVPVMAAGPIESYCYMMPDKPFWMIHVTSEDYMSPAGYFGTRAVGFTPTYTYYVFTRPFKNAAGFTVWVKNSDIICIN